MNHWTRLIYAFMTTIVVSAVVLIGLAFVSEGIAYEFLYDYYWAGIFVVAYFIAPLIKRLLQARTKEG